MGAAARAIIGALKLSGVVSLDFILSGEAAYLLELNARPIGSSHLGRLYGHDILAAALHPAEAPPPTAPMPPPPLRIALFPNALDRNPDCADLVSSPDLYHDAPWDDPEIIAAYSAWLDRRHPRRAPRRELTRALGAQ